jgi:hypothetical protein
MDAMIEVGECTIGLWSVSLPAGDWLQHLGVMPDGTYEIVYRFRWYRDDKTFDSADEKRWFRIRTKTGESEAHALEVARYAYGTLNKLGAHWELMRGARSSQEFADVLLAMPGMTARHEVVAA